MIRITPPLNALRAFEVAARHLSFTKAADELFVTQAAVSHQIKLLEEFLSTKLFLRKNRNLLLTEDGQAYYFDVKDIFQQINDATERLLTRGAKGSITVAMQPSFAAQWLVPRISQFSLAYPDIDVRIKAVDYDEGFLDESIDIAIYYGRGRWSGLHSEQLHKEYLTPVCSPMLFSSSKPLENLTDLSKHILLHDSSRENWKRWLKKFDINNVNVNQGPMFSHSMLVLQAAALGQGIALANTMLAKPEIDSGRLICPFAERVESKDGFYIVSEMAQFEQEKITLFREWLLSQVKEER